MGVQPKIVENRQLLAARRQRLDLVARLGGSLDEAVGLGLEPAHEARYQRRLSAFSGDVISVSTI